MFFVVLFFSLMKTESCVPKIEISFSASQEDLEKMVMKEKGREEEEECCVR